MGSSAEPISSWALRLGLVGGGGSGLPEGGNGVGGSNSGPAGSVSARATSGPQVLISYAPPQPQTPTPTTPTPSPVELAPTGGPDLWPPLIGLGCCWAGLALFLVGTARGRPSRGR